MKCDSTPHFNSSDSTNSKIMRDIPQMSGERGFLMLVEWDDLREKGIFLQFQMIQVKKNNPMMKLSNQKIQRDEEVMRKSRSVAVGCLASGWVL